MPEHPHAVHFTKDQRRPTARRIHVEEDLLKVAEQVSDKNGTHPSPTSALIYLMRNLTLLPTSKIQQSDSRSKKHIASITPTINSDAKADGLNEEKLKEVRLMSWTDENALN